MWNLEHVITPTNELYNIILMLLTSQVGFGEIHQRCRMNIICVSMKITYPLIAYKSVSLTTLPKTMHLGWTKSDMNVSRANLKSFPFQHCVAKCVMWISIKITGNIHLLQGYMAIWQQCSHHIEQSNIFTWIRLVMYTVEINSSVFSISSVWVGCFEIALEHKLT